MNPHLLPWNESRMRSLPGRHLQRSRGLYAAAGKRFLDIVLAAGALFLLAPVWLLVALLVRLCLGAPVIFRQTRPGLGGRPFTLFKFRTMSDERNPVGDPLPDTERLNRFGRLLRSSSLDELPELLNVLKGDMSLVGPRPFLMEHLPLYTAAQARRHAVRPGITGWAQINGRNQIPFSRRIELDLWYVENLSLRLDLRILLLTLPSALASKGVNVAEPEDMVDIGRKDDREG